MKYNILAYQKKVIGEYTVYADSEKEAIDKAYLMNYKTGLGLKYWDNLEANTVNFVIGEEE